MDGNMVPGLGVEMGMSGIGHSTVLGVMLLRDPLRCRYNIECNNELLGFDGCRWCKVL